MTRMPRTPLRICFMAIAVLAASAPAPAGDAPRQMKVRKLLHQEAHGALLGVSFVPLTPELRRHFGVPEDEGVLVSRVLAESPAAAAGIQVGDIVTKVDGESAGSGHALARVMGLHKAGDTVNVELWRAGRAQTVSATLVERQLGADEKLMVTCEPGDKDCPMPLVPEIDCPGEERCEVRVVCRDPDDCTCTVNGEERPCPELRHGHPAE
jgi:hypothetical protein